MAGAIILMSLCLFVYFVPSMVAARRKNVAAIFVLNLLLGWTLVGWVVALVWALASPIEGGSGGFRRDFQVELLPGADSALGKFVVLIAQGSSEAPRYDVDGPTGTIARIDGEAAKSVRYILTISPSAKAWVARGDTPGVGVVTVAS